MKKIVLFCTLGIFLSAGILGWIAQDVFFSVNDMKTKEERQIVSGAVDKEELDAFKKEGKNPFGQSIPLGELSDFHYQEYIHGMSHQKVKAKKKWGYYEMHPERITWLLNQLDQITLEHEEVYRTILEKWNSGDFSTADHDHNAIWRLQDGTIGKATGVLSPDEEQAYIQKHN